MFSSKANTGIRFYTQPKYSHKHSSPQSLVRLLLTESKYATKYPVFFPQHHKYIVEDYKKKAEEITSLRQKFAYTQRTMGINQNKSSLLCERSSLSPKRVERKFNKIKTQLQMTQKPQQTIKSCANTINLQCLVNKPSVGQKDQKCVRGVSEFQRNAIKRMKARQDIILKKKCDSLIHETQRKFEMIVQNMCLNSMNPKERALRNLIFQ